MRALLVSLFLVSTAPAQLPYVKEYGQRKDAPDFVKKTGVYWPDKRIQIGVSDYVGQPVTTYYQPYDFPVPSGPRNSPRIWYPVQIDYWTDGRPWIRRWAYAGYIPYEYRLQYDLPRED